VIKFVSNCDVGKTLPAGQLRQEYDAVVLCGGATRPNDFFSKTEGRNLQGIHFAMEFLQGNTKSLLDSDHVDGQFLSAYQKDVVVLGGGDTGTDCVGTALRHGCRSLVQLEIVPRPPLERASDNPWPQWPKVYRLDYGQEEAQALWGEDPRRYAVQTTRFLGDDSDCVRAIETVDVEWVGTNGRATPRPIPGTEKTLPAQLVLLALGFGGPESYALDQLGIERDQRNNARAEHGKFSTNIPGVFAAGDMRRGQSLVVWAINEGRGAAREVDRYLLGTTALP
jgi:glutamate synthase (NADPH/NADH) small chain